MIPETRRRALSAAGTVLGLAMLALAAWIFKVTLSHYEPAEAMRRFREIPLARLGLAILCAALSYFIQSLYDWLSLSAIGRPSPLHRASLAGFVSNAMVNNMGFSLITAVSLRFRFYSGWGYRPLEIAQVVVLTKLAFFLGLASLAGATAVLAPMELPGRAGEFLSPRLLGFLLLVFPAAALLASHFSRSGRFRLGKTLLMKPSFRHTALIIGVSALHLVFSGLTLYFLMPSGALREAGFSSPLSFLAIFMAIKVVVLFFPIPGGLGVLEGTSMAMLTPSLPAYPVLGGLLAYRLVYYVLPFAVALVAFLTYEVGLRSGLLAGVQRRVVTARRRKAVRLEASLQET